MKGLTRPYLWTIITFLFVLFLTIPALGQDESVAVESPQIPNSWLPALDRVPEIDRAEVVDSFGLAGANIDPLLNVLLEIPDQWLSGAIYLIKNMPVEDLTVVTEEMLTENLRLAYEVRVNYPWAANVSESDFFEYVLPMRVSQEPLENWRPFFYELLKDQVEGLQTLEEVTQVVRQVTGSLVGFKQTQNRDQGPFESIASGYGRCEEIMIVLIDGCRAVGVPARQAWTPYWTYQDNNHAWTEVLGDDGNWWDAESARDVPAPGNTWVTQGCERTAFVFSIPFGLPDPSDPDIYRYEDTPGSRYAILNSIPYYRDSTELMINVIGIDGTPMPDTDVYFSIWNYGALRPVAKSTTDENGMLTIKVGPGGYVISAGNQESGACEAIQIPQQDVYEMTLRLGMGAEFPPGTFWLRYPWPEEVQ
ncbi:MAG: transglutaminase domain-containing protein [bacterium]|nr:transglutaminase domain-containing protein [bacterium]